ncbi:hypothetical protein GF360_03250 [candidate division WWE3 bacterium]|nr:hypothetical protein [candidate division WWE3 bacterium]
MFNVISLIVLALLVLMIDAAAIMDLTGSVEPSYVLEVGFLIASPFILGILLVVYLRLRKKEQSKKPRGRF